MMIIHANEILNTTVGKLNHHYFGWVEDAQGFVFISGLVVGLVYGGIYRKSGFASSRRSIWRRIRTIYSHQIFLIALFLVATIIFLHLGQTPPKALQPYAQEPVLFPLLSAMLVTGSLHMGILPMYILFLIFTPWALRLLDERRYMTFAAISLACWAFAQTRLPDLLVSGSERALAEGGYTISLGIFFNVLGWQALFFGGLLIGYLMVSNRLRTGFLATEDMRTAFFVCIALFFVFGIYDRIVFDDWFGSEFSELIKAETDRGNFSTIYPVTFLVDLIIVVWLLGPGLTDRNGLIRVAAKITHGIASFPPLVFLGQHSLHVFTAHIVIVYVLAAMFQDGPPGELIGAMTILLCVAMLYAVAWLHAKAVARGKAIKALKAG